MKKDLFKLVMILTVTVTAGMSWIGINEEEDPDISSGPVTESIEDALY
ncbi:hypothetical protein M4S82_10695 [Planococcus sp. MERTA32b]|nr:hypothetical protein [Planococcus sp. MER TA 32b]